VKGHRFEDEELDKGVLSRELEAYDREKYQKQSQRLEILWSLSQVDISVHHVPGIARNAVFKLSVVGTALAGCRVTVQVQQWLSFTGDVAEKGAGDLQLLSRHWP
jgi:hypothetical protein